MFAFMYPYAEIQVPVASLMAQASHLSEQITQLLQHDRLEIQEHYKAWVHVRCRFQKAEGWILKAQVQPLTDAATIMV